MFRLTEFDDGFFLQRGGRTGLHAGAAGNAIRFQERFVHAGGDPRRESASIDGQRIGALHFLAGTHTARAHDASGRIETEIGIGLVFFRVQVIRAVEAVTHLAQADRARYILQFAITVGGTGQAIERMIRNVQLEHIAAQPRELRRLGTHHHARLDRRGA